MNGKVAELSPTAQARQPGGGRRRWCGEKVTGLPGVDLHRVLQGDMLTPEYRNKTSQTINQVGNKEYETI